MVRIITLARFVRLVNVKRQRSGPEDYFAGIREGSILLDAGVIAEMIRVRCAPLSWCLMITSITLAAQQTRLPPGALPCGPYLYASPFSG
jgi:hypothetical protein